MNRITTTPVRMTTWIMIKKGSIHFVQPHGRQCIYDRSLFTFYTTPNIQQVHWDENLRKSLTYESERGRESFFSFHPLSPPTLLM